MLKVDTAVCVNANGRVCPSAMSADGHKRQRAGAWTYVSLCLSCTLGASLLEPFEETSAHHAIQTSHMTLTHVPMT